MKNIRSLAFDEIRTARLNVLYFRALIDRYRYRDNCIKIIIAIATSSIVAAWISGLGFDQAKHFFEILWKFLTLVAAVISIVNPLLRYNDKINDATYFYSSYVPILRELEDVFYLSKDPNKLQQAWQLARDRRKKLTTEEHKIDIDLKLQKMLELQVINEYKGKF